MSEGSRRPLKVLAEDSVARIYERGSPIEAFRGIAGHDSRKDEVFTSLESFEPAREAVGAVPHFEERFGEPESHRVTLQFIYHLVARLTEPTFDEAAFDAVWSDLEAEVADPEWVYLGLANLRNFDSTTDRMDFSEGISIRGRNHDELAELGYRQGVLGQMDADWHDSWGASSFVLLVEDRIAKEPDNVALGNTADIWTKANRILGALRLSADGDVSMSRLWLHRAARFPVAMGGGAMGGGTESTSFGNPYQLTDDLRTAIQVTYDALQQLEQTGYTGGPGNLDLALGTFMSSYTHHSLSPQRLVDLITSLEALLGTGTEIAFRLAFRVANLLGTSDSERVSIFNEMKAYYDTRSRVVHGAPLKARHQEHLANQAVLQTSVRRLLRAAVHLRTEGDNSTYSKRFFREDLNAALLDGAARDPLRRAMGLS